MSRPDLSKPKGFRRAIALLVPLLVACSSPQSTGSDWTSQSNSNSLLDILTRLNAEGSFAWEEDRFASVIGTDVEHIYFGGPCAVWVFPSYESVKSANDQGVFDFYQGEVWYGQDSITGKGIGLLTDSKESGCGKFVFGLLNWSVDESANDQDSTGSSSMEGEWGSYSWMGDQVGAFLIVKSNGGSSYTGTFYTQGQSGGVFKDSTVDIVDLGDGLADVTWPSGNTTVATWGKRDSQTATNVNPNWMGDIWFDCLGELDFAESRADCEFYLVTK